MKISREMLVHAYHARIHDRVRQLPPFKFGTGLRILGNGCMLTMPDLLKDDTYWLSLMLIWNGYWGGGNVIADCVSEGQRHAQDVCDSWNPTEMHDGQWSMLCIKGIHNFFGNERSRVRTLNPILSCHKWFSGKSGANGKARHCKLEKKPSHGREATGVFTHVPRVNVL